MKPTLRTHIEQLLQDYTSERTRLRNKVEQQLHRKRYLEAHNLELRATD